MFKRSLYLALIVVCFAVSSEARWTKSISGAFKKAKKFVAPYAKKAVSAAGKAALNSVMGAAKDEFDENYNYDDLSADEYNTIMMDTAEQLRPILKPDALAYVMEELDNQITSSRDISNEEQLLDE